MEQTKMYRIDMLHMIDMHAHLCAADEVELRDRSGITTCFSSGTPAEWQALAPYRERKEILVSFGIHPWYADQYDADQCREYFAQCDWVGEIGMDSVWCEVPLSVQQRQLERQLQIAADLHKSVILHTKGQEDIIADMVRGFPGRVCVHWYSGAEEPWEKFFEQGCYFTLGPDTAALCQKGDRLRQRMVDEIPVGRMFVETDGISAVAWARGAETADIQEIPEVLRENMAYIAAARQMPIGQLADQMRKNLQKFIK